MRKALKKAKKVKAVSLLAKAMSAESLEKTIPESEPVLEAEEEKMKVEEIAEAPAKPEWPSLGEAVVVGLESLAHALRMGQRGTVETFPDDEPDTAVVRWYSTEKKAGGSVRIPIRLLSPAGKMLADEDAGHCIR